MFELGVVIVTYNRLEKLKKALLAYEQQTYLPCYVLVIDNCSSDGTDIFLKEWSESKGKFKRICVGLKSNTGGSGGFFEGLKRARTMEAEWIWVADDDAYPDVACFEELYGYTKKYSTDGVTALCAAVYAKNKIDTWHRRKIKKKYGVGVIEERINEDEYQREAFYIDLFSYVGTAIKAGILDEIGFPRKDFFIAYDDSEHSIRVKKGGEIVCLPKAKVVHDTDEELDGITWKKYYGLRNKIYSYKIHFGKGQAVVQSIYYLVKNFKNITLRKMTYAAVRDALSGRLGLNNIYKPGWKEE